MIYLIELIDCQSLYIIEPGTTMTYWTFNNSVPGSLIRVRVGDNVTLNFMNNLTSEMIHSIDLHAVTDTGGGAK